MTPTDLVAKITELHARRFELFALSKRPKAYGPLGTAERMELDNIHAQIANAVPLLAAHIKSITCERDLYLEQRELAQYRVNAIAAERDKLAAKLQRAEELAMAAETKIADSGVYWDRINAALKAFRSA